MILTKTTAQSHAGDLKPTSNASINLGSSTLRYATIYGLSTSAQYADIAERFASDTPMDYGTVVALGGAEANVTVKIWLMLLVHALVLVEEVPATPVDIFPPAAFALLFVIAVMSASKFDNGNILPPVETVFDAFVTLVPW